MAENYIDKKLDCNLSIQVSEVLKIPATWAYNQGLRLHFEWVWDGGTIYLVQADQEREYSGVDPTLIQKIHRSSLSEFKPRCLKEINETHTRKYNKIHNVFTYMKLGLPTTPLYILEDQTAIESLASGKIAPALENRFFDLVKGSLVIRMDVATEDKDKKQLLPRTHEVREIDKALSWLKRKKFRDKTT